MAAASRETTMHTLSTLLSLRLWPSHTVTYSLYPSVRIKVGFLWSLWIHRSHVLDGHFWWVLAFSLFLEQPLEHLYHFLSI